MHFSDEGAKVCCCDGEQRDSGADNVNKRITTAPPRSTATRTVTAAAPATAATAAAAAAAAT